MPSWRRAGPLVSSWPPRRALGRAVSSHRTAGAHVLVHLDLGRTVGVSEVRCALRLPGDDGVVAAEAKPWQEGRHRTVTFPADFEPLAVGYGVTHRVPGTYRATWFGTVEGRPTILAEECFELEPESRRPRR